MPSKQGRFKRIKIDEIDSPKLATRFNIDDPDLTTLAESINAVGLMQPIVVTVNENRYRLVAGQRRVRACKLLGWTTIPAHIMAMETAAQAQATVIENLQRHNLLPLEEAVALADLIQEHNLSQEDLAQILGVHRSWIAHRLQLLRLPDDLQDALQTHGMKPTLVLELARITKAEDRAYYLQNAIDHGATLQIIRDWVRSWLSFQQPEEPATPTEPGETVETPRYTPVQPKCLVCGGAPPQRPLKMVYLCWDCAAAIQDAGKEKS